MDYESLLERATGALGLLPDSERTDAERVLGLCRDLSSRDSTGDASERAPHEHDSRALRELGRLIEVLSRRSAKAIPFATLARAALAARHGAPADARELLRQAEVNFTMFGF